MKSKKDISTKLDKRRTNTFFSGEAARERLAIFKKEGECFPLDVVVHPTTRCNHSCNFCYHRLNFQGNKNQDFDINRFLRLTKELKNLGVNSLILSGGGEPFEHKFIDQMIKESSSFPYSSIYTNLDILLDYERASALAKLSDVNVNINTSDQSTYHETRGRGANLRRVIENINFLSRNRVGITGIITAEPSSLRTLERTIEDLDSWGVKRVVVSPLLDLYYKTGLDPRRHIDFLMKIRDKLKSPSLRILEPEDSVALDKEGNRLCSSHYFDVTIGANEGVYPCCNVAYLEKYKLLNLRDYSSFREAWSSKERKLWIKERVIGCKSCWFSPVNYEIERAKND